MDSPASISRFLVFLQVFQPFFSWLRKCPSIQSAYNYNPYCKYKNQDIHYFKILFASKADKVVNIIPNTAIIHILAFSVSDNNGNIRPITMPANMSFDKSKKYPASFSLLVASLFFISSLIFPASAKFPMHYLFALFCKNRKLLSISSKIPEGNQGKLIFPLTSRTDLSVVKPDITESGEESIS